MMRKKTRIMHKKTLVRVEMRLPEAGLISYRAGIRRCRGVLRWCGVVVQRFRSEAQIILCKALLVWRGLSVISIRTVNMRRGATIVWIQSATR